MRRSAPWGPAGDGAFGPWRRGHRSKLQAVSRKALVAPRRGGGVNAKVLALFDSVKQGFSIAAVEDGLQGGVRIRLRRGRDARAVRFEHFEVPAILQACRSVGVAK